MNDKEKRELKDKIVWWKIRADHMDSVRTKEFCRFFIYYMCFDAWITAESGADSDRDKIKWFKNNDSCLKKSLGVSSQVRGLLTALKNHGPIKDMRPNHNRHDRKVSLNQINNMNELIDVIYQIRCNLFHGSKNPDNPDDANLVSCAGDILEKWVRWADLECL